MKNRHLPVITDTIPYKYGLWHREGKLMVCIANRKTIPTGFRPKSDAIVMVNPHGSYLYVIVVEIEGWETKIRQA